MKVNDRIDSEKLTWATLLARWIEFARTAVAFAKDDPVRVSVGDIIMLQAVWFALRQMDDLDESQRALGLDRAAILIEKHTAAIAERWPDDGLPDLIVDLISDTSNAWDRANAASTSENEEGLIA